MRAAVYARTGGVEVIELREVAEPVAGTEDVLIDVAYAGLNRADILKRQGRYGPPEPGEEPLIPGLEYAGTVASSGARVRGLAPGDRVFGIVARGAHAERLVTNASTACRIPPGLDLATAAAMPEAFMTAWDALFRRAGFSVGHTAVVHAVGSSVGLAALALVKLAGGTALGTSRSPAKLERARKHGLDAGALLDDDWPALAREMTGGRGADVVLDFVGVPIFERNVAALATGGQIIQIGTLGGVKGSIALGGFMAKRATLVGTVLAARPLDEKIALARAFEAYIVPLFASRALGAVVDRVFPLDEIREAHRYMEEDRNFGKIVLAIEEAPR